MSVNKNVSVPDLGCDTVERYDENPPRAADESSAQTITMSTALSVGPPLRPDAVG